MVLDLTMASPSAFMQALLSMWKIIPTICGSVGHLYLWVYIARTPCSWGKSHQKGHGPPLQLQTTVCCLMTPFVLQELPTQPFHGKREANANVVALFSKLMPQDSCLRTHASRLMPQDSLPVPLCFKDRLDIILYHIVSFTLQFSLHHKIEIQ